MKESGAETGMAANLGVRNQARLSALGFDAITSEGEHSHFLVNMHFVPHLASSSTHTSSFPLMRLKSADKIKLFAIFFVFAKLTTR